MKKSPAKKVTVRIPEEQYLIIRSLALKDRRSTSNQICFLLDLAIEALQLSVSSEEEENTNNNEKTTTEAIGFKIKTPTEEE